MKHEYLEGKQAGDNFVRAMRAVFQAPRVENPKRSARKSAARKKRGSDKAQNGSSCPVPAVGEWNASASFPVVPHR